MTNLEDQEILGKITDETTAVDSVQVLTKEIIETEDLKEATLRISTREKNQSTQGKVNFL